MLLGRVTCTMNKKEILRLKSKHTLCVKPLNEVDSRHTKARGTSGRARPRAREYYHVLTVYYHVLTVYYQVLTV